MEKKVTYLSAEPSPLRFIVRLSFLLKQRLEDGGLRLR